MKYRCIHIYIFSTAYGSWSVISFISKLTRCSSALLLDHMYMALDHMFICTSEK